MNKEQRVEQMTTVFAQALKSLEQGKVDDLALVPFSAGERVEIVFTKRNGEKNITIINAPF